MQINHDKEQADLYVSQQHESKKYTYVHKLYKDQQHDNIMPSPHKEKHNDQYGHQYHEKKHNYNYIKAQFQEEYPEPSMPPKSFQHTTMHPPTKIYNTIVPHQNPPHMYNPTILKLNMQPQHTQISAPTKPYQPTSSKPSNHQYQKNIHPFKYCTS